ncbi:MAG: hypothetical protein GY866_43020 [Proteobacteria bacterium]|nr:hypothetical protein [Pseudomonadota bacterium]
MSGAGTFKVGRFQDFNGSAQPAVALYNDSYWEVNMTNKDIAIETIRNLPDDTTWQENQERINFIAGVRKGFEQIDQGEGIPIEKVEDILESWTQK